MKIGRKNAADIKKTTTTTSDGSEVITNRVIEHRVIGMMMNSTHVAPRASVTHRNIRIKDILTGVLSTTTEIQIGMRMRHIAVDILLTITFQETMSLIGIEIFHLRLVKNNVF